MSFEFAPLLNLFFIFARLLEFLNKTYIKDMANIFTSSIGKKLIMSISGLFLIILDRKSVV